MNEETKHQLALIREVPALVRDIGPLWLIGGWSIDFLAGRIRRPHYDIDWEAVHSTRPAILSALEENGFRITHDLGWHTRLTREAAREYGEVEIDFLQVFDGTPYLVVTDDADNFVKRGRYRLPDNELDPDRIRELQGIRALVTSPMSELAVRLNYSQFRVLPDSDPKYDLDRKALRSLLRPDEQEEATKYFRREPLTDSGCNHKPPPFSLPASISPKLPSRPALPTLLFPPETSPPRAGTATTGTPVAAAEESRQPR